MTLKMLKPGLGYLRGGLPLIQHRAPDQIVERVHGGSRDALKRRVLARCGSLCECPECQAGYPIKLTWDTSELDHVLPLHLGGGNEIGNLRALHKDCHKRVTAQQMAALRLSGRTWIDQTS